MKFKNMIVLLLGGASSLKIKERVMESSSGVGYGDGSCSCPCAPAAPVYCPPAQP